MVKNYSLRPGYNFSTTQPTRCTGGVALTNQPVSPGTPLVLGTGTVSRGPDCVVCARGRRPAVCGCGGRGQLAPAACLPHEIIDLSK
jgi:hypothetical protein